MAEDKGILSRTISLLRFPLAFMVVWMHVSFTVNTNGIQKLAIFEHSGYAYFRTCSIECLASISVPLFFFISGFLFFYKTEWSKEAYFSKLRKRIKSLLVPYLFWIAVLLAFTALYQQLFLPESFDGLRIADYSISDWLTSFGIQAPGSESKISCPFNGPLWFIRDLIVITIISPVIYLGGERFRKYNLILMTLLEIIWLATDGMVTNYSGPFCFSLGALFAIRKTDFVVFSFKYWKIFAPLFLACMIGYIVIMETGNYEIGFLLQKLGMLFGIFTFIALAGLLVKKGAKIPEILTKSGLLIYVYHGIFSGMISQIKHFPNCHHGYAEDKKTNYKLAK